MVMSQEQQQDTPEDEGSSSGSAGGQQQQQPQAEGHAGHGSESIIKQLREWENRRASHSGGKRRLGPH
jgi:hypothetical protein